MISRAHELGRMRLTALRGRYLELVDGHQFRAIDGMTGCKIAMDGIAPVYVAPWDRDRIITAILELEENGAP